MSVEVFIWWVETYPAVYVTPLLRMRVEMLTLRMLHAMRGQS